MTAGEAPTRAHPIRVGGLVTTGSVQRQADGLTVRFDITDNAETMTIQYTGILPDLFREGQGIVALGELGKDRLFVASEVLAKHDENYMPPEVADALKAHPRGKYRLINTMTVKSALFTAKQTDPFSLRDDCMGAAERTSKEHAIAEKAMDATAHPKIRKLTARYSFATPLPKGEGSL